MSLSAGLSAICFRETNKAVLARPGQVRLFAALVPVELFSLYFLTLVLLGGVWWPIPLWTGAIVLGGVVGWFVSYLIVPPVFPGEGSRS